jgi:hypothetical protein
MEGMVPIKESYNPQRSKEKMTRGDMYRVALNLELNRYSTNEILIIL